MGAVAKSPAEIQVGQSVYDLREVEPAAGGGGFGGFKHQKTWKMNWWVVWNIFYFPIYWG